MSVTVAGAVIARATLDAARVMGKVCQRPVRGASGKLAWRNQMPEGGVRVAVVTAVSLLLAAFFLQGFLSLRLKSPTFDEVAYFGVGQYLLETGRFDVPGAGIHPPLSFYLTSLPLLGRPLDADLWKYPQELRTRLGRQFIMAQDQWRGQQLFSRDHPPDRLLNRCRTVVLSLSLFLGLLIFLWARREFGLGGGFASLALFAFDPNLLAHSRLITPDFVLVTTFFAATFFSSFEGTSRSNWYWILAGLFAGLALLSKHAALVLLPALAVVYLADRGGRDGWARAGLILAGVLVVAALVVTAGFQLRPSLYIESLRFQLEHASSGHRCFLWGRISEHGWWYYYLVALALKTPLPLFILATWALLSGAVGRLPRRRMLALLLPPAGILLAFTLVRGPQIGLRYILPVYPFLITLAGGAVWAARRSVIGRVVLVALVSWQVIGTLRIFPDYLAYFNETVGGPRNGYKYLVDSNLDWGQDLKQLKAYIDKHRLGRVRLSYFGAARPEMYGIEYETLPGYYLGSNLSGPVSWQGTFAVSATNLMGVYLKDPDTFAFLRKRKADAMVGYSILIYNLE